MSHVAYMGVGRGVYRILVWKREGKSLLRKPTRRCVDNIKMDLHEVGFRGKDWIEVVQDMAGRGHL